MPREGLSGRPPFDPWDNRFYEQILRSLFLNRLGVELVHDCDGVPSFLFDAQGIPFQAPDFDWVPGESAERLL